MRKNKKTTKLTSQDMEIFGTVAGMVAQDRNEERLMKNSIFSNTMNKIKTHANTLNILTENNKTEVDELQQALSDKAPRKIVKGKVTGLKDRSDDLGKVAKNIKEDMIVASTVGQVILTERKELEEQNEELVQLMDKGDIRRKLVQKKEDKLKKDYPECVSGLDFNTRPLILDDVEKTTTYARKEVKTYFSARHDTCYLCTLCWTFVTRYFSSKYIPILQSTFTPLFLSVDECFPHPKDTTEFKRELLEKLVELGKRTVRGHQEIAQRFPAVPIQKDNNIEDATVHNCAKSPCEVMVVDTQLYIQKYPYLNLAQLLQRAKDKEELDFEDIIPQVNQSGQELPSSSVHQRMISGNEEGK